jgi:glutathione peroxidase
MIRTVLMLAALIAGTAAVAAAASPETGRGVLSFTLGTNDGQPRPLASYQGQVLLIVNTASKCGLTPQYSALETLYQRYKDRGLRVLAFPANDFGAQEPGTNEEIRAFCSKNYGVTFDLFAKISVKGEAIHPLYRYLTTEGPDPGDIRWNFTKFLVDRQGRVVARFEPRTDPLSEEVTTRIEQLLQ